MASNKTLLISPESLFALLVVSLLGIDFLNLPHEAVKICGPSGYWAIVVAFLLFIPVILLIAAMNRRFPGEDLFGVAAKTLGRPLSVLGNLVFLSTFIYWLPVAARDSSNLVLTYLLNHTPLWAVLLPLLALTGYIAVHGLTGVGRMAGFVLIPTFAFRVFMQLLAFQQVDFMQIRPVFSATPLEYLHGGVTLVNAFLPLATMFLIFPCLSRREKVLPVTAGAAVLGFIVFFLEIFGTTAVFGSEYIQRFLWPNLAVIHRINIPYLVLEQVGLLFLIVWLTMFVVGISYFFFILAWGLKRLFPVFHYKITIMALLMLAFIVGILLTQSAIVGKVFEIGRRWAPLPVIAYPILVYFVALLRGIRSDGYAS